MVPGEDMEEEEDELPFDISGDEIHLEDDDYGVWFIDAMERPELYDGKTIGNVKQESLRHAYAEGNFRSRPSCYDLLCR